MTVPPVLSPPGYQQTKLGWIAFVVIAGLMVLYQNVPMLIQGGNPSAEALSTADRLLAADLYTSQMQRFALMGSGAPKAGTDALRDQIELLDPFAVPNPKPETVPGIEAPKPGTEEEEDRLKSAKRAASYLLAIQAYLKEEKLDTEAIRTLQKNSTARDRAVLAIVSRDKLTETQAERLGANLEALGSAEKALQLVAYQKSGVEKPGRRVISDRELLFIGLVLGGYVTAGLIGSAFILVYVVLRASGKLRPLGHPTAELSEADAGRYAMRSAQMLLVQIALPLVIGTALMAFAQGAGQDLTQGAPARLFEAALYVAMIIAIFGLSKLPVFGKRISLQLQGWHTRDLGKNVAWGIAAATACIPIVVGLGLLGQLVFEALPAPEHPLFEELRSDQSPIALLASMLLASIAAPLIEETLFRGTLLPALIAKLGGTVSAVVVTSLVFAALHPTGVQSWAALAGIGALAAILTIQTRSLIPAVVMHALYNGFTVMMALALM